jgi:hypothetical protein
LNRFSVGYDFKKTPNTGAMFLEDQKFYLLTKFSSKIVHFWHCINEYRVPISR